jgi:hypothetical protein
MAHSAHHHMHAIEGARISGPLALYRALLPAVRSGEVEPGQDRVVVAPHDPSSELAVFPCANAEKGVGDTPTRRRP